MTLAVNSTYPTEPFVQTDFRIGPVASKNRLRGGKAFAQMQGPSYWEMEVAAPPMESREFGKWDAFFDSQRGGARSFLGHDTRRCRPYNYSSGWDGITKHGGGAFVGIGAINGTASAHSAEIDGLPTSFALVQGDYVSFVYDNRYSLHRIVTDATAALGVVTIAFEPELVVSLFPNNAVANFEKPLAEFMISEWNRRRGPSRSPVSFTAASRVF